MVAFDAMETVFHADPYPTYKHLRDEVPAFWYPEMGFWLLTRYADVAGAVRDPELFSHESFWDEPVSRHDRTDEQQAHVVNSFSRIMMYRDGAEHARMRRQSNRTFAPRQISESLASVERICRTLLEDCRNKGTFDYAQDFAFILPSLVIADYLGIPTKDRSEIRELADRFSVVFEHFLPETDRAEMLVGTVTPTSLEERPTVARLHPPAGHVEPRRLNPHHSN